MEELFALGSWAVVSNTLSLDGYTTTHGLGCMDEMKLMHCMLRVNKITYSLLLCICASVISSFEKVWCHYICKPVYFS